MFNKKEIAVEFAHAAVKIKATIDSCTTRAHLEITRKVINNWVIQCRYHKVPAVVAVPLKEALSTLLGQKALEIYKEI